MQDKKLSYPQRKCASNVAGITTVTDRQRAYVGLVAPSVESIQIENAKFTRSKGI